MANWQIKRNDKIVGTVNGSKLRQLAIAGKLKESDLLCKEGTEKWVPPSKVKGLYEPKAVPDKPKPEAASTAKSMSAVVSSGARIGVIKTQLAKIDSISLPSLFRKLGEAVSSDELVQNSFSALCGDIRSTVDGIKKLEQSVLPQGDSVFEKAKVVAATAANKGKSLVLVNKLKKLHASLGKSVFESKQGIVLPNDLKLKIERELQKKHALESEINSEKRNLSESGKAIGDSAKQSVQPAGRLVQTSSGIRSKLLFGTLIGCGSLLACLALLSFIAVAFFGSGTDGKPVSFKEEAAASEILPKKLRSSPAKTLPLQAMLKKIQANNGFSTQVGFSPKGEFTYSILTQSNQKGKVSNTLRLWKTTTGEELSASNNEIDYFSLPAVFSPSEDSVACLDGDFLRVWKLVGDSVNLISSQRLSLEIDDRLKPHIQWLSENKIIVSTRPDPNRSREYVVVSSFNDETPNQELINCIERGTKIKNMNEFERQHPVAVVAPNGRTLAFRLRHKIVIQDVETDRIVKEIESAGGGGEIDFGRELRVGGLHERHDLNPCMTFTPDSNYFMSFVYDSQTDTSKLVVWDSNTWAKQGSIDCRQFQAILCFSNDLKFLAALAIRESKTSRGATYENEALIFNVENTKLVARIPLGEGFGFSDWCLEGAERRFATFSPDNSSVAIALSGEGKRNRGWRNDFSRGRTENVWAAGAWNIEDKSRRWIISQKSAATSRFAIHPRTELLAYFDGAHAIVDTPSISLLFENLVGGDSAWSKGEIEDAFEHYSNVASHSDKHFYTERLPQVFARCIDYYGDQSDSHSGRQVADYMLSQGMEIQPETGAGKELVSLYQEEKSEAQAKLMAENAKIQQEKLEALREENKTKFVQAKFMTKAAFVGKMKSNLSGGAISANSAQAVFHNFAFQDVFGDPDSNVAWDNDRLIQYNCSDGAVQMVASYNGGHVWITEVNLY